ncbi:hypothetical protein D9M71_343130 [compost metagenome]
MAVTVRIGDKGVRNGRRREEEHRPFLQVALVIEVHPHRAALDVMHLEKAVMAVHRHVTAEEIRQLAQRLVMHLGIGITLIVGLADMDVGDRRPYCHQHYSLWVGGQYLSCFNSLSKPSSSCSLSSPNCSRIRW